METLLIGLKNKKAIRLLKELKELNLIELLDRKNNHKTNLSALKDSIVSKMDEAEINNQFAVNGKGIFN